MLLRSGLLACLLLLAPVAHALCPPRTLTPPEKITLRGDAALIVTHASSNDDARAATKIGLDAAIALARGQRIPRVYLQDDRPEEAYFMDDCQPDYWVHSNGGELSFPVNVPHVLITGGHLEECLQHTLHDILLSWARRPAEDHSMTLFMDAIFSNGKLIEEEDPYYNDFVRFLGIVSYGRPGGEHYPKLTLLETMGVILKPALQHEFLKRTLPKYARTLGSGYRVVLAVNNEREYVLQPGSGWRPPVMRFHFVDSAIPGLNQDPD